MTQVYNTTAAIYNTAAEIRTPYGSPLYQTLSLLRDLTQKHGYAWASNRWLADRLNCTERTITRHITQSKAAGYIRTERANNKRHVHILKMPNDLPTTPRNDTQNTRTNVQVMSTRCLPASIRDIYPKKQDSTDHEQTENPLVSALISHGVSRSAAQRLADTEPEQCRKQLDDLKNGTVSTNGIKDLAAWLISAIKNGWKHKKKKADASATQSNQPPLIQRPKPTPQTNADADAWNALPKAERQQIEIIVRATLSSIEQRSQHIIRANCLKFLKDRNTAKRYDDTSGAAYSASLLSPSATPEAPQKPRQKPEAAQTERPPGREPPPPPS